MDQAVPKTDSTLEKSIRSHLLSEPHRPRVMHVQPQGWTRSVDRGSCRRGIEPRNHHKSECRHCSSCGKATPVDATTRVSAGLCEVEDPRMYGKLHARDPGGPTNARHEVVSGPVGEGDEPQVQYERW